jgi:hypothetical protein
MSDNGLINDPHWPAQRQGLGHALDANVGAIANALAAIAKRASA